MTEKGPSDTASLQPASLTESDNVSNLPVSSVEQSVEEVDEETLFIVKPEEVESKDETAQDTKSPKPLKPSSSDTDSKTNLLTVEESTSDPADGITTQDPNTRGDTATEEGIATRGDTATKGDIATEGDAVLGSPAHDPVFGVSDVHSTPPPTYAGRKFVLSSTEAEVYVSYPSERNLAGLHNQMVILLTNSLGLASTNNLILADLYSEKLRCPVIVPDLFQGDPVSTSGAVVPEVSNNNLLVERFKVFAVSAVKGFFDEMWSAKHTFARVYPRLKSIVAEIIQVYQPEKIAVIGYSFGARYVLHLLQEGGSADAWATESDVITTGAAINPSFLESSDFKHVHKPLYLIYGQDDELLPQALLRQGFQKLTENNIEFDKAVFSGENTEQGSVLPHGFAVPGDYPQSQVADMPQEVINLVSSWIQEH